MKYIHYFVNFQMIILIFDFLLITFHRCNLLSSSCQKIRDFLFDLFAKEKIPWFSG